ncbi:restriction endonuclease subunit S [Tardiphaga sp. 285_C5_N1_2]|uniref:restriction endonuclease subunit S n=1 Tax=Tardiphaga sp. 285_C5_N1_2 TaxID=3240775 RepID=UPI003F8A7ADA
MSVFPHKQLRFLFTVSSGATPQSGNSDFWDGDIFWATPEDVSGGSKTLSSTRRRITKEGFENCSATMAPAGSIVLTKRAPIGQLAISEVELCCNQGCFLLEPTTETDNEFFYYWLTAQTGYLQVLGRGSTFMELSTDEIKAIQAPCISIAKQRHISKYLTSETAEIDALIAAKQLLLDLLAEKRRAIVAEAILRGLTPSAPLRPSGTDWLGDIPAHWEACHLKRVLAHLDYGTSDATDVVGSIAILRMGDIRDGELDFSKLAYLDQVEDGLLLQEGDLVFNRTNSLDQIGKVALFRGNVDFPISFASYLVRLRCEKTVLPEYLNWVLNSSYALAWARAEALPSIGQANLNPNRYGYLPIALPPLAEQQTITKHLANSVARQDGIRAATEYSITLLKERRDALIASAVTGQIEIPEAA